MEDVEDTIGKLNAQLKILLVEPTRAAEDRQNRVQDVRRDVAQPYEDFCQFFDTVKADEKINLRRSALDKLWEHFCQWHALTLDLRGKVGSAEDPGDGLLYRDEHVNRANALLKDLHQAWSNMEDCTLHPPPEKLRKMGRICLILAGMGQLQLFEDFLDNGICDDDLQLSRDQLLHILRDQHAPYIGIFLSEQYRAKPRPWNEGDHAKMEDEEPLPFKYGKPYKKGSYGIVTKVEDIFTKKPYALKQQIVSSTDSNNASARKHLRDEAERLKGLNHKHIVRLVKSYERAESYGLLLAPAATTDLVGLLGRYHKNNFNTTGNCSDQEWLRPIFLNAFGCLSQGLAYTHRKDIRHKDIKPGNILYEKASQGNDGPRFLWADFGLAYDFSSTGNSKTNSTSIYSRRYAAPEILMASTKSARPRPELRASTTSLERIVETSTNGEATRNDESGKLEDKTLADIELDAEITHGRKTDIFSLGCVFLELLAVLVNENLPMPCSGWNSTDRVKGNGHSPNGGIAAGAAFANDDAIMFCKHFKELKEWALSHTAPLKAVPNAQSHDPSNAPLAPLFELSTRMIAWKADDRPSIDEVVQSISAIGTHHFCQSCLTELSIESKVEKSSVLAHREKVVKPKRTSSMTPESPVNGNSKSLLKRSATILRVDSYGPTTSVTKIASR